MTDPAKNISILPPEQQAIRDKCFHPTGTFVEFSKEEIEQSVAERFEKIVDRYPDRLAVKMGEFSLTYDDLNKAANRVARGILDRRGPQQEPVIVLFDQGVKAIAAILGVLKAGKFYVPIDPSFPDARIAAILDDAQPGLLVTDNRNIAVARNATKNFLNIDEIDANVSNEKLNLPPSPDDLAYLVYTSGSTGKPKGVFQKQRNVLQWTLLHSNTLHICAADRLSLMHSHSTSGGTHRIYDALLNGAALFPFDFRADGTKLANWLMDERITIYQSGPLVFRQWVDALTGAEAFPELRLIRLSGMPMSAEDVACYRSHFSPDCLLVHVLGTSEGGTIPHYFIDKCSKQSESPIPVGYSIGDSKVFVVDESGRRAESEVLGEIVIQSRYLVCGYWRNAELTNERFLPDPEGGEERLYFTGDLGRMTAGGCLYHLGRKDFRVKIRGYSVEISEIESTLREHPAIKEVVVISGADAKGEPQLTAYLVPAIATAPTASTLRNFLTDKLPEYMVPSIFITLPAMPLTPNGKIDRKALPAPPNARPGLKAAYVAPRTPLEQKLKKIWSEVLCLDDIGVDDNFFDLGGHSLRAAQVVARIRQCSQVEIPLQTFFAAPTLTALADYIENVRQTSSRTEIVSLERISRDEPLPLSFAQQRLWFLDQLEPGSIRYNVALALLFTGPLDVEILKQCLDEIVERHESLRTVITVADGRPYQNVVPTMTLDLPVVDLSESISEAARDSAIQQFITGEAQRPFDLSSGPLLRSKLLSLAPDHYVLLLTLHHIAFDGWSGSIVLREIASLYADFLHHKSSNLPELRIQYSDYAVWQRRSLEGAILKSLFAYWKKQLENLPRLELPTDRRRPSVQSCRGARKYCSLSATTTRALNALGRQENATLFMVLVAAFQTLLHRYTGQTDVVTGTPVAGRRHAEIENLVGFFLNMLVLRIDLSADPTFRQLLARTRQTCLDAYAHEDLPFEILVEELKPERSINQNPLFQVSFVLQNFPKALFESAGITAVEMDIDPGIARFDLHVFMTEEESSLKGYFEYNTDLFDAATIERMVGHFQTLLDGIVVNPDLRISELPVLRQVERRRLLIEWNDTGEEYAKDKCLHQLFEEQVERTPDAVGLVFENQQLTYRELNNRANHLAHYLQKHGVGPDVLVGICVERSIEMVVGLLGILKAGGAYVPLDPEYPKERLAFMLEDAKVGVLLTQQGVLEELPQHKARVICLDGDWGEISQKSEENPSSEMTGENLAYVIYTSGSTGRPKGVAVEHRQVLNYVFSVLDRLELPFPKSFATVSTLAADLGNTVIFSSLCTGAALHVMSRDRIADAEAMADYFSRHAIDCLKIVPSHLAALQAVSHPERVLPRQLLILGGEASDVGWIKRLASPAPSCRIINHYGPTETTVGVMTYAVDKNSIPVGLPHLPLGRPLSNIQIYILDPYLNPVPVGVAGELHIGGVNVTRGYLHAPELTAEKFIPNPFSDEPGARLYKTGDRARYLSDGNIEFLGRIDSQIKLRGYRIEPGEIEAALRQHSDIRESVVEVREDEPGDKRLIGYVVARPDRAPTAGGKLRYRLPNGAAVAHLNKNETDYIYQEIFERQAYLRHGITIEDGDCIFDVGANIGLFTLFANQIARRPRVYSFEPNPAVYEILSANTTLYGSDVRLFNCGLSNEAKSATFTFFPGFSLLSGFYADAQADKEVVKAFMINQHKAGISEMTELVEQADAILEERFKPRTFDAELRTVSSVIEQENIERIDLLKINVEKSELDVLLGIEESDWQKIKQIVLEVDVKENLPIIISLLQRHGYEYVVEQDNLLQGTSLCYVYAIRPSEERELIREQPTRAHVRTFPFVDTPLISVREVRAFLATMLPEYMIPSSFVFLDALPLTPNGKVDRLRLAGLAQHHANFQDKFDAPRTPVEELLVNIWAKVLNLDKVGIHSNFFELGGHSLLVAQVVSRVRQCFQMELPLRGLFEHPTVAGLAKLIGSSRAREAGIRDLPIVAATIHQEYPLSFSQERFWFLSQLEPNNLAYKVTHGFRLTGPLSVEALEQTLSEIVRRHEILRTTVQASNGSLAQRISDLWSIQVAIIDLTEKTSVDRDLEVQRLFEKGHRRSFDLSCELLLRAMLVKLSNDEHALFLSSHHVAWDHWCTGIFLRELSVLYQAFANAQPSPLTELPIQYKDYALWQRKVFQGAELESQLAYWKKQLAGAPPVLDLPIDHPRKPLHNRQASRQTLVVPKDLDSALRSLSRNSSVTFFMTLLAAFQTLLYRLTGEDDIVVGTPVAGRNRYETESLLGLFLNSLALRTNLSGNPSFLELLTRVREVALGAYDHQELPFEKLVEALQPERDLTRTPIFQVFINMYNFKEVDFDLDRLTVSSLKRPLGPAPQFDLEFYIREHEDGAQFAFVYDSDLFESATIARLLAHFQILLEGIVANPEQRIADLPILSESEKHQVLVEWNDTKIDYPKDKCIHQLFEEQTKRTPESVAVVFEDRQLTYGELNRRANQLAHYLKKLGVSPELLVGICVERSLEMIIGLLGILKAGGAYVPLDPEYPKERLAFMLEDAKVEVLLTQEGVVAGLPEHRARVICLDGDWGEISKESEENPSSETTGENLAYVIYTSGSTGKPKGVEIQHRSVVNFLISMQRDPGLTDKDTLLAVTTLSFDIFGLELYLPITVGARVVIVSREVAADGMELAKKITNAGATIMQATPATWRMLLDGGWQGKKDLKILCGGEAVTRELAELLLGRTSSVWNMYGPTETTIWSTTIQVSSGAGVIPLGRPISNTQVYLLDARLYPVPIGVSGEIYVGGDGLARGYLNRPELTQEKFLHNPFSSDPKSRIYRTGDLARYLSDGTIEYLGRIDDQVKLHGFRIELREIEITLTQHPLIREAVVLVRENAGDKQLVGYINSHKPEFLNTSDLRNFLQQKLPKYMVPSGFIFCDALPLSPNGKVNRNALPTPEQLRPELDRTFLAPRTSVEELLVNIWANVLKLDKVGIRDNFFELGGHSLLATQVLSHVRQAFQIELPLRTLFEKQTVDEFAKALTETQGEGGAAETVRDILSELESLSDEEVQRLMAAETVTQG